MERDGTQPAGTLSSLLDRLEGLLADAEALDPATREIVYGLLDGVDELHRMAVRSLGDHLPADEVGRLRDADPAIGWLFDAYAVGVDERAAVDSALESIRPYIDSHGGRVDVRDVRSGVVMLEMSGACSGCTASAITLQEGIITALRDGYPGFVRVEVVEDPDAAPHPPPGQTLDGSTTLHQIAPLGHGAPARPGRDG